MKNLPKNVEKWQILGFFGTSQIWVKDILVHKEVRKRHRYATVEFYNKKTFDAALSLDGSLFDGQRVNIKQYDRNY